jgi:16S rRNA processing protein RimM
LDEYFQIGVIGKPHGIKGELRVFPTTDNPGCFASLNDVTVSTPRGETLYEVEKARRQKDLILIKFKGVDDRNAAELLKHGRIMVPPEMVAPLSEDEYFIRDLIGVNVFTDTGEKLGIIKDVLSTGANDVYVVQPAEGKDILIPAIKGCVLSVSTDEKKMLIRLMDGLLP